MNLGIFRKKEDEKLIRLLKNQPRFSYAKDEVKFKLLTALANKPQPVPKYTTFWFKMPHYGTAFAAVILAVGLTSTLVYADSALPGDKLFSLDRAQEELAVKIVPSQTIKAKLRAKHLNERAVELEQLSLVKNHRETKVKAVDQSVQGLNQAIQSVSEAKIRMQERDKNSNTAEFDKVLHRLENLAEKHEQHAVKIRGEVSDPQLQQRIDNDLRELKEARMRARMELEKPELETLPLDDSGSSSVNQDSGSTLP